MIFFAAFFTWLDNSRAVTVGPVKLEYSVDPGAIINGELFLQNEGAATNTFYPSFEKFTEANGEKRFMKEDTDLPTWFKIPGSIVLKAGESRQIPFTLNIPQNAPPGGHFAVIWWSTTPPGPAGQQVSITTKAGIVVYLRVSGDIKESADISLSVPGRIFGSLPVNIGVMVKNTGNSYIKPLGELTLRNIFGQTRLSAPVNKYGTNILPESERSFDAAFDSSDFFLGPYTIKANIIYGDKATKFTDSYLIWILPWKGIVVIVLILLIIFLGIPRSIKRYNAWIVKKARGGQ